MRPRTPRHKKMVDNANVAEVIAAIVKGRAELIVKRNPDVIAARARAAVEDVA
jgi:hypothetical protein